MYVTMFRPAYGLFGLQRRPRIRFMGIFYVYSHFGAYGTQSLTSSLTCWSTTEAGDELGRKSTVLFVVGDNNTSDSGNSVRGVMSTQALT